MKPEWRKDPTGQGRGLRGMPVPELGVLAPPVGFQKGRRVTLTGVHCPCPVIPARSCQGGRPWPLAVVLAEVVMTRAQ